MNESTPEPIPDVCFIDDLARALRTSRRTIQRLRRHRALPIPEIPSIDRRPRFAGDDVRAFLARRSFPSSLRLAKGRG